MRTFVTKCVVGDIVTEGEGNGKKVSITDGGELMLAMVVMIVVIMILSQNMLFMTLSLEMTEDQYGNYEKTTLLLTSKNIYAVCR